MPPAAHASASERARRVPRSARERMANWQASRGCRGGVAGCNRPPGRELLFAFDPLSATTSACALQHDGVEAADDGVEAAVFDVCANGRLLSTAGDRRLYVVALSGSTAGIFEPSITVLAI